MVIILHKPIHFCDLEYPVFMSDIKLNVYTQKKIIEIIQRIIRHVSTLCKLPKEVKPNLYMRIPIHIDYGYSFIHCCKISY